MAEMCPREETSQTYLHLRSNEHATKKVKRSIKEARGKGKRISSLSAPQEPRCVCVLVHCGKPGQPELVLLREQQADLQRHFYLEKKERLSFNPQLLDTHQSSCK